MSQFTEYFNTMKKVHKSYSCGFLINLSEIFEGSDEDIYELNFHHTKLTSISRFNWKLC